MKCLFFINSELSVTRTLNLDGETGHYSLKVVKIIKSLVSVPMKVSYLFNLPILFNYDGFILHRTVLYRHKNIKIVFTLPMIIYNLLSILSYNQNHNISRIWDKSNKMYDVKMIQRWICVNGILNTHMSLTKRKYKFLIIFNIVMVDINISGQRWCF